MSDFKYKILYEERDENMENFSEIREILEKNSHHFKKINDEMHHMSQNNFFNKSRFEKKPSMRQILNISNTTYYIDGYNYIIAYRMLLSKKKPLVVCELMMEHSSRKGKIYQSTDRDVYLSHYFDRLVQRGNLKNRKEAIKKTLNDILINRIVAEFAIDKEDFAQRVKSNDNSLKKIYSGSINDLDTLKNVFVSDTFFTSHGIGLCEVDISNNLFVVKTYVSKEMLFENQDQMHDEYVLNNNKLKAAHFFEYNQLKKIVNNIYEKKYQNEKVNIE